MQAYDDLASAYLAGLRELRNGGAPAPPVTDPYSKASDFGRADRPAVERLGHQFAIADPRACMLIGGPFPVNIPYCFGLLAWSLEGRDDVDTLAYYRVGAREFSDDGYTLSGAFGRRLFGRDNVHNQLSAIQQLLRRDPASRRTFAAILQSSDNLGPPSREYPCAIGYQLFLRDRHLHVMTYMRAQQALTVLPYDAFLFMGLQCLLASQLEVEPGVYMHTSGTFHFYQAEEDIVDDVLERPPAIARLPFIDPGHGLRVIHGLIEVERGLREATLAGDRRALARLVGRPAADDLVELARYVLGQFAVGRSGQTGEVETRLDVSTIRGQVLASAERARVTGRG